MTMTKQASAVESSRRKLKMGQEARTSEVEQTEARYSGLNMSKRADDDPQRQATVTQEVSADENLRRKLTMGPEAKAN